MPELLSEKEDMNAEQNTHLGQRSDSFQTLINELPCQPMVFDDVVAPVPNTRTRAPQENSKFQLHRSMNPWQTCPSMIVYLVAGHFDLQGCAGSTAHRKRIWTASHHSHCFHHYWSPLMSQHHPLHQASWIKQKEHKIKGRFMLKCPTVPGEVFFRWKKETLAKISNYYSQ